MALVNCCSLDGLIASIVLLLCTSTKRVIWIKVSAKLLSVNVNFFLFCFFVFQQVVLDLTFGAGGHSKAILQSVPGVTVVAADRDPTAFQIAQRLAEEYP